MRGLLFRSLFSLTLTLFFVATLLTTLIWYVFNSNVESHSPVRHAHRKSGPAPPDLCKDCGHREIAKKAVERYAQTWKKREDNLQRFRSQLSSQCHAPTKAIVTQSNTPVGSKLVYDGERRKPLVVTPELFSTFAKQPFLNKTWDTCAVVGNGGILANSSCGQMIDSAQFVFRCNLPPVGNHYNKDVGNKTHLVTANPSIFHLKYGALMGRRRPFVESLRVYGDSMVLVPAFSYDYNTPVSLRALYTMEDFECPTRTVFFNPEYMRSLAIFWRSRGLRPIRLSTGMMVATLALELCAKVELYGFWPFSHHPHRHQPLTNHYFDNTAPKKELHAMPSEFNHLLRLHSEGVLKLHLGDCGPSDGQQDELKAAAQRRDTRDTRDPRDAVSTASD
ncbi:alpha-2,8-sialyltransferase 8F isoform X2 [Genypterus blacodes]|uniref:alpha-2,8-sialyltransferase 8F isoform X2 n=1 Tax=Genypterus blacodes TaxID=154954 RepID=UPI003F7734E0